MPDEKRIQYLRPGEILAQLEAMPVAYQPIGTLEWHGRQNPIGVDTFKAEALCIAAAQKAGGLVMPAIILTSLWVWVGFNMVYFLAALQSVDKSLEEAARIDGAGPWQVFWNVTLPSMRHVVIFVLITCVAGSYQLFELPLALLNNTDGRGPADAGLTLITYLNEVAFRYGDLGMGSAIGWVVALIIFAISIVQIRISRLVDD